MGLIVFVPSMIAMIAKRQQISTPSFGDTPPPANRVKPNPTDQPMSERKRYPEHERQYPWLGPLLETYHRTDRTIQKDLKKSGKKVACGKGCDVCCHNMGVPITEPEVPAVSWYVVEMMRERPGTTHQRDRGL